MKSKRVIVLLITALVACMILMPGFGMSVYADDPESGLEIDPSSISQGYQGKGLIAYTLRVTLFTTEDYAATIAASKKENLDKSVQELFSGNENNTVITADVVKQAVFAETKIYYGSGSSNETAGAESIILAVSAIAALCLASFMATKIIRKKRKG